MMHPCSYQRGLPITEEMVYHIKELITFFLRHHQRHFLIDNTGMENERPFQKDLLLLTDVLYKTQSALQKETSGLCFLICFLFI